MVLQQVAVGSPPSGADRSGQYLALFYAVSIAKPTETPDELASLNWE